MEPRLAGVYVCRAELDIGSAMDQAMIEMVPYETKTHINVYPASVETDVGQRAEFVCNTTDLRPSIIRWRLASGGPLPSGITEAKGVLTIPSVEQRHYGAYTCVLSNSFGIHNKEISLIRPRQSTPESRVTVNPRKMVAPFGTSAQFECTSSVYPPQELRWTFYRDRPLPQGVELRGGRLVIPSVNQQHYGAYQCLPKNEPTGPIVELLAEPSRDPAPIYRPPVAGQPEGPLEAVIEPTKQTVPQGTTARMVCLITSGSRGSRVTWSKVNGELSERHRVDGNNMLIDGLLVRDRGLYVCNVQSPSGSMTRASAILEVEAREPPLLKIHPGVTQTISTGGSALFQCRVEGGTPEPVVRWTRADGLPMTPNTQVMENGVIRFSRVTGPEKGVYKCVAENVAGKVDVDVTLNIQPDPNSQAAALSYPTQGTVTRHNIRITQPNPHMVRAGEPLILDCQTSNPQSMVEWARVERAGNRPLMVRMPMRAVYQLPSAAPEHSGIYLCVASDGSGVSESSIRVVVRQDMMPVGPGMGGPGLASMDRAERMAVEEGSVFEATCQANVRAFWVQQSGSRSNVKIAGERLRIDPISVANTGEFICFADSPSGRIAVRRIRLEVGGKLRLRISPENQTASMGDNVAVYCIADGQSEPTSISWSRESGPMGTGVIAREGELRFTNILSSDSGGYICTALSPAGSVVGRGRAHVVVVTGGGVPQNPLPQRTPAQPRRPTGRRLNVNQMATETLKCDFPHLQPHRIVWEFNQLKELPENAQVVGNDLA